MTVLHCISMIFQTKYLYYIHKKYTISYTNICIIHTIFQGSFRSAHSNTFVIACLGHIYSGAAIKANVYQIHDKISSSDVFMVELRCKPKECRSERYFESEEYCTCEFLRDSVI